MKLKDFIQQLKFNSNININEIQNSHPLQWINQSILIPIWKVEYTYRTINNKIKRHIKYIFYSEDGDDTEILEIFNNWVSLYNEKHPFRALSNVEILDISFIEDVVFDLE